MYVLDTFKKTSDDKFFEYGEIDFTLNGETKRISCARSKHRFSSGVDVLVQTPICNGEFHAVFEDGTTSPADVALSTDNTLAWSNRRTRWDPESPKPVEYRFTTE